MIQHPGLLFHILRIACAMCFIGHGAFGIITKSVWCNYFGVFGIGESLAYQLMPVVGVIDIVFGAILLIYPIRIAAGWLVFWGLFTAMLRPLSAESFAEFLERAGNYGAPIVLMLMAYTNISDRKNLWFQKLEPADTFDKTQVATIVQTLQWTGFLLLVGHGWLNLMAKPGLVNQYASLGFENPVHVARLVGAFEIAGAASLVVAPLRSAILFLFAWKVVSETQYPVHGFFEWVERAGSYAALLALWIVLKNEAAVKHACSWRSMISNTRKSTEKLTTFSRM